MANNAIHWVIGGLLLLAWWYVGHADYYAMEGAVSDSYWAASILTVALIRA